MWSKMVGNRLQITPEIYNDHLEEALRMYDNDGRLSLTVPSQQEQSSSVENAGNQDITGVSISTNVSNAEMYSTVSGSSSLSSSSIICEVVSRQNEPGSGDSFSTKHDIPMRNSVDHVDGTSGDRVAMLVASMTLIQHDIPRTFPTLSFFHDEGPLALSLDHVLKAYACYEPSIGYVQVIVEEPSLLFVL